MTGCAPPPDWERMENPDIKGNTGMAAVDNFVDANGWNMNKSPCKCQSSLLTPPGRVGKGCPCRGSCALNTLGPCITS